MERNTALCRWLGIRGKREHTVECEMYGYDWGSPWRTEPPPCTCQNIVYPALATREGFWVLWDALKAKGYLPRLEAYESNDAAWISARNGLSATQLTPTQIRATPPEALFEAAWQLMQREVVDAN